MCSIENIRLLVLVFSVVKAVVCIYIFAVGIVFSTDEKILHAFGDQFVAFGIGLAFIGVFSAFVIPPHVFSIKRHNRFVLLCCFLVDTILFSQLIFIGLSIQEYTVPAFNKDFQLDCLKTQPEFTTADECAEYLNHDRTAGFRLMWTMLYTLQSDSAIFQIATTIEGGSCCGFYAPFKCIENTDPYPSGYPFNDVSSELLAQRVTCGNMPDYYPEQHDCADVYDPVAIPPIMGGCFYDLGFGSCVQAVLTDNSAGCASATEDYMVAIIAPQAFMITALSAFNALSMLLSCCMFWKRREYDVFPEFTAAGSAQYSKVNYKKVKEPFQITPTENVLSKRGFIEKTMDEEIQDQKNKLFVTESVQQRVRSAQLLKSRNGADNVGLDGMDPPEGERNEYDDEDYDEDGDTAGDLPDMGSHVTANSADIPGSSEVSESV